MPLTKITLIPTAWEISWKCLGMKMVDVLRNQCGLSTIASDKPNPNPDRLGNLLEISWKFIGMKMAYVIRS